jgi:hypothetical protein
MGRLTLLWKASAVNKMLENQAELRGLDSWSLALQLGATRRHPP